MTLFLQLLILGCATGGIYAISAMGLVLVFRSSGVINFASGAIAMVAGYVTWTIADVLNWPHAIAIPVGVAVAALIGYLTFILVMRPLSAASTLTKVIATLGIFVVLQQGVLLAYGSDLKVPSSFLPRGSITFGGVGIGIDQLIILLIAAVLTLALWWFYRTTRFGLATSAVSENPRSLAALGWKVEQLRAINWALGGALCGVAGIALAPTLQLQPATFALLIIPTLASAMLGGLRSFPLTLLGGIVLGVLQAECSHYISLQGVGDAIPFLVIIGVLIVSGRSLPLRNFVNERLPRVGSGQIGWLRLIIASVVIAVIAQFVLAPDLVDGLTVSILAATILLSQVVVTGYAGQLSLAQLPIAGVGAIIAGRVVHDLHAPFLLALLVGGIVGVLISLLVGLPSLRARGVSLAIATLGFGVAINAVILQNPTLTGGSGGTNVGTITLFGLSLSSIKYPGRYAIFCGIIFILLALLVANVRRGRAGRRMLAVRGNERAAASLGVNVAMTKLYAFTFAGFIAGVGGVLMVFRNPVLTFRSFDALTSVMNLVQSVIGGIGYVLGAFIGGMGQNGGFITSITNQWLFDFSKYLALILGLGLIIQVIVQPNGIADVIAHNEPKWVGKLRIRYTRMRGEKPVTPESKRRDAIAEEVEQARQLEHSFTGAKLTVQGVSVRYGSVTAVDDVTVEVNPGEVVSVIGPNGAGKTSLMDAIAGYAPTDGQIRLGEEPLSGLSPHRRSRLGLIRSFQSLELLEDMTVLDNLRCASDPIDVSSMVIDMVHPKRGGLSAATAVAIDTLKLGEHLHKLPTELAYGDRHLVAIARAIAASPRVLMLDEPAAGLSETERAEVGALITTMAKEWGIAVLLIEHDVALVRRVSDRVIALDFGKLIASGAPDDVLTHPKVIDAYLGQAPAEPTDPTLVGMTS